MNLFLTTETSRNGSKFSIAYNDNKGPVICTEDYVVFKVRDDCKEILNARWLYMFLIVQNLIDLLLLILGGAQLNSIIGKIFKL